MRAAIDASVRELASVSRLGIVKKNRNNSSRNITIYSIFTLVQRYPPCPDSCETGIVCSMSFLLHGGNCGNSSVQTVSQGK